MFGPSSEKKEKNLSPSGGKGREQEVLMYERDQRKEKEEYIPLPSPVEN